MNYQVGDLVSHSMMGGIAIITGIAVGGEDPVYRTKWLVTPTNNYEPISAPQRYLTPTKDYSCPTPKQANFTNTSTTLTR